MSHALPFRFSIISFSHRQQPRRDGRLAACPPFSLLQQRGIKHTPDFGQFRPRDLHTQYGPCLLSRALETIHYKLNLGFRVLTFRVKPYARILSCFFHALYFILH